MAREMIVVLRVLDDNEDREWWHALGLPDPARWSMSETFGEGVLPSVVLEEEIA